MKDNNEKPTSDSSESATSSQNFAIETKAVLENESLSAEEKVEALKQIKAEELEPYEKLVDESHRREIAAEDDRNKKIDVAIVAEYKAEGERDKAIDETHVAVSKIRTQITNRLIPQLSNLGIDREQALDTLHGLFVKVQGGATMEDLRSEVLSIAKVSEQDLERTDISSSLSNKAVEQMLIEINTLSDREREAEEQRLTIRRELNDKKMELALEMRNTDTELAHKRLDELAHRNIVNERISAVSAQYDNLIEKLTKQQTPESE